MKSPSARTKKNNPAVREKKTKSGPARPAERLEADYRKAVRQLQKTEDRLRFTEQRYRSLIESIPDIIYTMDLDGSLSFISPRWKSILGHEEAEVLGKFFVHFAPPEEHPFLAQVFKEVRNNKKSVENVQWQYFKKDGLRRYFLGSAAPMLNGEGQVTGVIGIARDVTEHKLMEEQLLQAQKMESIGNLAGGIAHDFNNLLGGILGYATFIKRKLRPQNKLYHSVAGIEKAAQRAAELTRQLLGFARPTKYRVRPIDLNALIQELLLLLRRTIDRRIDVTLDLSPHLPPLAGDEASLQQSLMNICLNARDAMPQGGKLGIKTRKKVIIPDQAARQRGVAGGEYTQVVISDTGTGMTPEVRAQIFDPFFTTKDQGRGTGLGLALVYGIIQNHGGTIEVQSRVGQGSAFTLLLPAANGLRLSAENEPVRLQAVRGTETILLVDDEEIIRELATDLLKDRGYRVIPAAEGREALKIYKKKAGQISLVVLDVVMPGIGGKETFIKLKAVNPQVKALLSSGYSARGEVEDILKLGACGFVQKPYREEELAARVREIIDS